MSHHQIPKTQTAAVLVSHDAPIQIKHDYPVKQPEELAPGECLVKLHCTGVCHTDLHARKGDWPLPSKLPLVGGHEGVGDVVAIGGHTVDSPVKVGDRVGIKWLADSCLQCEQCRKGLEQCMYYTLPVVRLPRPNSELIYFHGFAGCAKCKLSGYTVDGTFQEYVVRPFHFTFVYGAAR
jgi:propanol-preferring alcohol dehydrogenase